ncbi:Coiled-coil domain-containing protein [Helicobacter salomonis]|uniref:Coiled-coil domain-containing protein n=1 Tax=Helicobacter salomonis TaxID=56878 RepID=UPI000CF1376E|nr:Coiled-coil domain-containing protein [Helicobacter salomonis]
MDTQSSLAEQETQLEVLKREIEQAEASLESDFAKHAAQNVDSQLEELFFGDKEAFFKKILEMQNSFLKEKLGNKVEQANQLQQSISAKKGQQEVEQAQKAFLEKHPEADMNALTTFYNEDLPPKYKKELEQLEGVEFFEALYQLYQAFKGENKGEDKQGQEQAPTSAPQPPNEELPQRVEGNPTNAQGVGPELVMNRF